MPFRFLVYLTRARSQGNPWGVLGTWGGIGGVGNCGGGRKIVGTEMVIIQHTHLPPPPSDVNTHSSHSSMPIHSHSLPTSLLGRGSTSTSSVRRGSANSRSHVPRRPGASYKRKSSFVRVGSSLSGSGPASGGRGVAGVSQAAGGGVVSRGR